MPSSRRLPFEVRIAGIGVDAVFGVNPVAMVFGEPLHAIGLSAFFIAVKARIRSREGVQPSFFKR